MDEMLAGMTARQLTEWIAYERMNGFGERYSNEMLAQIHELLQNTNILVAQQKNAKPKHVPRPWDTEIESLDEEEEEQHDEAVIKSLDMMIPVKEG